MSDLNATKTILNRTLTDPSFEKITMINSTYKAKKRCSASRLNMYGMNETSLCLSCPGSYFLNFLEQSTIQVSVVLGICQ